jgi:N-acetylmuramoyl-L-alanine amidase
MTWSVPCKVKRAAHDSGLRQASSIKHVVIHSTEGGTAASVAAFFATTAMASTQLVVDDKECWRMVPDLVIPWGAPGVNSTGLHIEHCGFSHWSRADWLAHDKTLKRSAWKAAKWCWQYKIPRRWLTVAELQAGKKGFCRHMDATAAFHTPGGHTDPGPNFPRDYYMNQVKKFYAEIVAERKR